MAKKKLLLDEDDELEVGAFDPVASVGKMPVDVSGGKKAINEYMEVPCDLIIEYQNKKDSDFRRYSEEKFQLLVDSIRETGVMEAVTLRALPDGRYEMLAGEHRWRASVAAGRETVPAHVLANITDAQAEEYFSVTNILRRESSVLDRVNGWWHYYESHSHKLRDGSGPDMVDLALELNAKADRTGYTKRHILRYIKMHDLIQPLKDRLDAQFPRTVTLMAGYWLAFLPEDEQELLAALDAPISEEKAKKLRELSVSGELTENAVQEILRPKREVPKQDFRALNRQIRKAAAERLRPEYLPQAGKIFAQALGEYLDRHPEYRR